MELKGKISIVTGGARGIGRAIAASLVKQMSEVIIWDICDEDGIRTAEEIGCKFMKVDVSSFLDVKKNTKDVLEEHGKIDILINNAGITRDNLLLRMKEEEFDAVLKVNLKSVFNTTHTVLPSMIKNRWGRIVNLSSIIGVIGNKGQANYAASKAGIIGFAKSVAREVATRGITVNSIAPGFIETEMTKKLPDTVKEVYIKTIPMGRFGTPDDIANLVLFLVSESASYITGQVINIDGGMVM
ncbi:3-oxoacyl-[acyl-carrier-protein] reductase [candidate division WOR-3 bacterium]|nr:3-oxoacyl-[acyl-carrier-protein] reductase [candidate division WOR-3 bacterium]